MEVWKLCAMKRRLGSGKNLPLAGFEPVTPWTEVGSDKRSATWTFQNKQNVMCAQRRLRSAWTFAQSDQSLRFVLIE